MTRMSTVVGMPYSILERAERAVLKVRERLLRATGALNRAGIAYAVVGGHAVASWVATVDEGAVRNTRDVDILVQRDDLPAIIAALEGVGFVHGEVMDVTMFRDGPQGKPSEAIHLLFSGEKVKAEYPYPNPPLKTVADPGDYRVLELEELLLMKLLSHRDKDKAHLRDMIALGIIDHTWSDRVPVELADRLRAILDTPDG
jgi:hypothetical protein